MKLLTKKLASQKQYNMIDTIVDDVLYFANGLWTAIVSKKKNYCTPKNYMIADEI